MDSHLPVPENRTVTLTAQGHHVGKLHPAAVGQGQRVVVIRIVARKTGQVAMRRLYADVEFIHCCKIIDGNRLRG